MSESKPTPLSMVRHVLDSAYKHTVAAVIDVNPLNAEHYEDMVGLMNSVQECLLEADEKTKKWEKDHA